VDNTGEVVGILLTFAVAVPHAKPAAHQQNPTRKELKALIASAKTASDHEQIAAYYHAKARQLEVKYREHEEDLAEYYRNPSRYPSKYPTMGDHCRGLARYYKMAADRATTLAEMHEKLAQEVQ
jgi:hypothetical protein